MKPDTIFINIPVKDLARSIAFYTRLGFTRHPVFHSEEACCLCLTEQINLMLQTAANMKWFTPKPIADPAQSTGVLLCLHCHSSAQVNELVSAARDAGATVPDQAQDLDFLYTHGFTDPDGYPWKLNHIYPDKKVQH